MQFILRPWHISDLDSLVQYANNANIARFMTDSFAHPYTEESGRNFIAFATKDDPVRMFAIDIEGRAGGGIGLHPQADIQRRNAELGYWLGEPFWGKGIMPEAIRQITAWGFETLDIDRIFARVFGTNTASQKALEKAGFVLEARLEKTLFKNGEQLDELLYAVRRG
jgi:RimJ/RimL family protein N-acetyltransferase